MCQPCGGAHYLCVLLAIVSALYPNATAEWVNGQAEVKADGLTLHIKPGAQYVEANGRYLYVPDGVKCEGYSIMVPIRTLCQALAPAWSGTEPSPPSRSPLAAAHPLR